MFSAMVSWINSEPFLFILQALNDFFVGIFRRINVCVDEG